MDSQLTQQIYDQLYKDHSKKIEVTLRASKVKGDNYDKFRDVGYDKVYQNSICLKALTKSISPNSLIIRELGLAQTGALQIIVKKSDLSFLKLSEKIVIEGIDYTPWNKSLGSKFQVYDLPFGYKKVIIFRINE